MKKLIFIGAGIICLIIIVVACSRNKKETTPAHTKNGKILIVEYGDYKCPYCKKIEDNVMPIIKKDYIDTNRVEYQFINASFLGKDSLMGSRAGNAIQSIAPKEYLTFQNSICKCTPSSVSFPPIVPIVSPAFTLVPFSTVIVFKQR